MSKFPVGSIEETQEIFDLIEEVKKEIENFIKNSCMKDEDKVKLMEMIEKYAHENFLEGRSQDHYDEV